jgi:hypothetical protein
MNRNWKAPSMPFSLARRPAVSALAVFSALFAFGPSAAQSVTQFAVPTVFSDIATTSDGTLWIAAGGLESQVGTLGLDGSISLLPSPIPTPQLFAFAGGPDGALWLGASLFLDGADQFTESEIGRLAADGGFVGFTPPNPSLVPTGITTGSDGAMWFAENDEVFFQTGKLGRITTSGQITEVLLPGTPTGFADVAAGADGALWLPEGAGVARVTTDGTATIVPIPSRPGRFIAAGPDGALWLALAGGVGRLTTTGQFTLIAIPEIATGQVQTMLFGTDSALWLGVNLSSTPSGTPGPLALVRVSTTGTVSVTPVANPEGDPSSRFTGAANGADGTMWLPEYSAHPSIARLTVPPAPTPLAAAVLPGSRTVEVGATATAFATIINGGSTTATSCAIAPVSPVGGVFHYRPTDPTTNMVIGSLDTPIDIPAGAAQSFVFGITPGGALAPTTVQLGFACSNADAAASIQGVNTLLFSASATPVPDIIAVAALAGGILDVPDGSSAAFAVATADVGAAGSLTVAADTGSATLPLTLTICETVPATGACMVAPAPSVATSITAGGTNSYGVFAAASGTVPFAPAGNRVFLRFRDSAGVIRGETSVAIRTP